MQVTDLLDSRPAAIASRLGFILSPKQRKDMRHNRVWGSIFKPTSTWGAILSDAEKNTTSGRRPRNLVLLGSDIEYLYAAKPRPHPLHFMLVAITNSDVDYLFTLDNLRKHFRSYDTFWHTDSILLTDFNINLHFDKRTEIETPWAIGVKTTYTLWGYEGRDLNRVDINYSKKYNHPASGSYTALQSNINIGKLHVKSNMKDIVLEMYSKEVQADILLNNVIELLRKL